MNTQIYFEIQANEPARAIHFYRELFGWEFQEVHGLPIPYWQIQTKVAPGGLLARPANTPPPECGTNAFVCSFEVEDFDAAAAKVVQMGGQIALPKFAVPGRCWQGYFIDTEGNTFGAYQPDASAK
ncbi:MAG: VOC family protein [Verrucomicrobiaceae bacterium]|nr:MAG: VOC family protein [Verrucomicrobiaceae bacterium]